MVTSHHVSTKHTVSVAVSGPDRLEHPSRYYKPVRPEVIQLEFKDGELFQVSVSGLAYRLNGQLGAARGTVRLLRGDMAAMPPWLVELAARHAPTV